MVTVEYWRKEKLGYIFSKGDIKFNNLMITKLCLLSIIAAFLVATIGMPGTFYYVFLVALDINVAVASAIAVYVM